MGRAAAHKQNLVRTAMRLVRRQGYASTGLQQILAESGAPKGSLYHYFPSKRRLLAVIRDRVFADVRSAIAPAGRVPRGRNAEHIVRGVLGSFRAHRDFWRMALYNRGDADVSATLGPEMQRVAGEVQHALERALESDGAGRPKIEAELLFATIEGVTQRFVGDGDYPIDEVTDALVRTLRRTE